MRQGRAPDTGLITILLIYIVLVVLIIVFANQILVDITRESPLSNFIILPIAILLPLLLLGAIILNLARVFKEKRQGKPGVLFKIRLIIFFSFISLLSSIPQGILSLTFVDTAMSSWFSSRLRQGLQGGFEIALQYHRDKISLLEAVGESPLLQRAFSDSFKNQTQAWQGVFHAYPELSALQVFTEDGGEQYFSGDERIRILSRAAVPMENGVLPKEYTQFGSVLRMVKTFARGGVKYSIIASILLPADFNSNLDSLTESLEAFEQIERFQTVFRVALLIFYSFFSIPIILLSINAGFILSNEMIKPLANLEQATRHVAEGDYSFRILARTGDELSHLTDSFNDMIGELERTRILTMQTEKVTTWQEIAQRMAHEIKNPLTPIKLAAQRILQKFERNREELDRILVPSITAIVTEVDNLDRMLKEFGDFAKLPSPIKRQESLPDLLRETVETYGKPFPGIHVDLSGIGENHRVCADRNQLKQVFSNLMKNAVEAVSGEGSIRFKSDLVRKGNSMYCRIQVQDTGCGISEEAFTKVFHPYYTTKPFGTGLGLPIVERIIFDHKGQIWFESQVGVGTTFFIDLPVEC